MRDGTAVGAVRGSLYLPAGYVKANGATVQRADYPRLVAWVQAHNLWTDDTVMNAGLFGRGDGAATFVLPNWVDRMVQLAGDNAGATVAAGLPNITGHIGNHSIYHSLFDAKDVPTEGALYVKDTPRKYGSTSSNAVDNFVDSIDLDASKSNPIYGASATVQPAAINLMPIIRY